MAWHHFLPHGYGAGKSQSKPLTLVSGQKTNLAVRRDVESHEQKNRPAGLERKQTLKVLKYALLLPILFFRCDIRHLLVLLAVPFKFII